MKDNIMSNGILNVVIALTCGLVVTAICLMV